MKRFILIISSIFFFFSPLSIFAQQEIPILVYHSIAEYTGQGSKELFVTPKNFEEQIDYLRKSGFTPLTFEQWQNIHQVNKPIFITFDDGYKNNLNALQIFEKLQTSNFKPVGTIFVISDFINRPNRLSNDDLRAMVNSGLFSIQSHTATHPDLTKITDYVYELKGSRDKISQITGQPVIALSYPYGNFNDKVVDETKKYYTFGLTTTPAKYSEEGIENEPLLLPRIYIKHSTSLDEFAKIVEGD
ncbi:polysaccharide deacetylase family protein [Mesobacillus maritimus]|uniref:polysaccharide deacetylase family protein n=1 Tax=Mesobacillus maritimus TaxID=1643336 RepID=UPI00384DD50E